MLGTALRTGARLYGGPVSDPARPPLVLVVDDEEHITELVAMGLGYNGFDVERRATGRAALDGHRATAGPTSSCST